jgi:hypothetical protein
MRRPGLEELAQLATVVSAVAVVISLVYVGSELSRNTAAVRGAATQAVFNASSNTLLSVAADSSLARIRQVGDQDPSLLNDADAYRYRAFTRQNWLSLQNAYLQNQLDLVDPRLWAVYARIICGVWSQPGIKQTWPTYRPLLDEEFVSLVEACGAL